MEGFTQKYLKERIHYNPETGIFTWKHRLRKHFPSHRGFRVWNAKNEGKEAGYIRADGYRGIKMLEYSYPSHRLAWLWMTGEWCEDETDHIDHNRSNNRWENLRKVTGQENKRNASLSSDNTSGFTGVSWMKKNKKWKAQIMTDRGNKYLGGFESLAEAVAVRKAANIKYNYHPNHGR